MCVFLGKKKIATKDVNSSVAILGSNSMAIAAPSRWRTCREQPISHYWLPLTTLSDPWCYLYLCFLLFMGLWNKISLMKIIHNALLCSQPLSTFIYINQWFLMWVGSFSLPGDIWQYLEMLLVLVGLVDDHIRPSWIKAGDAADHHTRYRSVCTKRNNPTQTIVLILKILDIEIVHIVTELFEADSYRWEQKKWADFM